MEGEIFKSIDFTGPWDDDSYYEEEIPGADETSAIENLLVYVCGQRESSFRND